MNKPMTAKKTTTGLEKSRRVKKDHASRPPLTRQTILQTALKLADNKGFDALSMRQLGRALNIEAMSIYHYFKNKEDLLDGLHSLMMQHIFKIMKTDSLEGQTWVARARSFAAAYRIVGRKHPHVFRIVAQRPLIMEEAIQTGHSLMDAFRVAGFNNNDAIVAYRSVTCFVAGFVLLENAALEPLYTTGDFDLEYTKGLDVIVAGIENRLSAKPMKALTTPARRPVQTKKPSKPRNNKAPLTA